MNTHIRLTIGLNSIIVLTLLLAAIYIKYGSLLEPEYWRRAEDVVRMFSDCFTREQPLYSVLNNCTEILWASATSVCLFSWAIIKSLSRGIHIRRFLLYSFVLLLIWMIDDVFRVTLISNIFLGFPKALSYSIYAAVLIGYYLHFRKHIMETSYYLLIIGSSLFVFSNMIDLSSWQGQALPIFLEEAMKLIGLANLTCYYWSISYHYATQKPIEV
ncbi:MAG: hypothetical protein F6K19_06525 [Cyanothece sp. SIO1E1]|nr:hypothetical protein [Cyanothece sp. SIO1E1]